MPFQYGTHTPPAELPADPYTARLADALGWHVRAFCANCPPAPPLPVRLILDYHPRQAGDIAGLVRRLRCRACGKKPAKVQLVDYPGSPDCRVVELTRLLRHSG